MVKVVEAARMAARKAQESLYDGLCTVTEHQKVKDERSKLTDFKDVVVLENQPCKLSFSTITTANQTESVAEIKQTTKLFISPDITIKNDSKITITQGGVTTDYTCSGVPAIYDTHQEIVLDLFEKWA
jgi:hypothetical protein